ncbi:hypothetical protein QVD17_24292 [Tagetes erecta]|uniref:RNA-directed DNA polymerase, eukaryota, reverse transcriptase zinc-binding domain protein n=1 Tax=Tagetes erecta TaxID=13708 RepID=A0AAD8NUS6_TARER|nr:hypothetical protein QVD17_24292 [Tagetes erecta]
MGGSNREPSSLATKLLKIDGNSRVTLLRGSSKEKVTSKTSVIRNAIRGAAINPNSADFGAPKVNVDLAMVFDKNPNSDENPNLANVEIKCAANVENSYPSEKISNVVNGSVDVGLNIEGQVSSSYVDMVQKSSSELESSRTKALRARESELLASFQNASLDEERFLKQKSKVHWLAEGDANTKFFHNSLKCRNHRARIDVITDCNGILHEGKKVPRAFVDHYVGFLGKEDGSIRPITPELFDCRIDQLMAIDMIREISSG